MNSSTRIEVTVPLRISLAGGGSDIPEYFRHYGGSVLSFSIEPSVRLTAVPSVRWGYQCIYDPTYLRIPLTPITTKIIDAFESVYDGSNKFDLVCKLRIPPGTGLATSSATSVATIMLASELNGDPKFGANLAEDAWRLETQILGDGIGKQDHYIAALGGLRLTEFLRNGNIVSNRIKVGAEFHQELHHNAFLVFSGRSRSAVELLGTRAWDTETGIYALCQLRNLAHELADVFCKTNIDWSHVGRIIGEGWTQKKKLGCEITSKSVDDIIDLAAHNGAWGSKLLGAGRGGFILVIGSSKVRRAIENTVGKTRCLSIDFSDSRPNLGRH